MLGNYLKTALRSLLSKKLYTLINLAGLSAGLTCFILIMIFVQYELSYERFFDKTERIFRISQEIHPDDGGPVIELATNSPQVGPRLKAAFPQVEQAARLRAWLAPVSRDGAAEGFVDAMLADPAIFEIFDFIWLRGSRQGALEEPDSVVLTASAARRYFGDSDAVGQSLLIGDGLPVRVVGVIEDLPQNTHLGFDMLAPMAMATSVFAGNALDNWTWRNYHTYVLLAQGSDIADLEAQFPGFLDEYVGGETNTAFSMTAIPFADIHLRSNRQSELSPPGSMVTVNAFIFIAFLVLLVACMNFMNLSLRFLEEDFNALYQDEERQGDMMASFSILAVVITCMGLYGLAAYNAQRRTKEVGVRKVMGGSVWSIVLLLTNDFSKLVLLSNVIAWPVAYFAMNQWLSNFAYRIDLTPLIFIGSGLIALCLAWVTVGGTAAKAASAKPVLALRYE